MESKLDGRQDRVRHDMTGKFMDPLKVEIGRLRELSWANKHKTHELVKDGGARGGPTYMRTVRHLTEVTWPEADAASGSWQ